MKKLIHIIGVLFLILFITLACTKYEYNYDKEVQLKSIDNLPNTLEYKVGDKIGFYDLIALPYQMIFNGIYYNNDYTDINLYITGSYYIEVEDVNRARKNIPLVVNPNLEKFISEDNFAKVSGAFSANEPSTSASVIFNSSNSRYDVILSTANYTVYMYLYGIGEISPGTQVEYDCNLVGTQHPTFSSYIRNSSTNYNIRNNEFSKVRLLRLSSGLYRIDVKDAIFNKSGSDIIYNANFTQ